MLRRRLVTSKIILLALTVCLSIVSCTNGKSTLEGSWMITKMPNWVKKGYLAHNSDVYQFLSDGSCIWGTAGGTYEVIEDNKIKVNFPMQEATPGYVGVLTFKVIDNNLILDDVARSEPIELSRIN